MTRGQRRLGIAAVALVAASALGGCTLAQDVFQVGEREFAFDTADQAAESAESFRFQGFLPDDATDIRLIAQLDGHASVMRWTSAAPFRSTHCVAGAVLTEPELDADWVVDPLPGEGMLCGRWTVVRSGTTQLAWVNSGEE